MPAAVQQSAFELHIWGPPIGALPSLDPDCLAAVTFLTLSLPAGSWSLVRAGHPSLSASAVLPSVRNPDGSWTHGYAAIVSRLHDDAASSDVTSPVQRADANACAALLTLRARDLLDATLFASERNWNSVTRPAFASVLRFPLTWTLPHAVRTGALTRLDRAPRRSDLLAIASAPNEGPTVRFDDGFFDALSGLLAPAPPSASACDAAPTFGSRPLDCLVYGFLAPMTDPSLPHGFVRATLQSSYPLLLRLVDATSAACDQLKPPLPRPALAPPARTLIDRFSRYLVHHNLPWLPRDTSPVAVLTGALTGVLLAAQAYRLYHRFAPLGPRVHSFSLP